MYIQHVYNMAFLTMLGTTFYHLMSQFHNVKAVWGLSVDTLLYFHENIWFNKCPLLPRSPQFQAEGHSHSLNPYTPHRPGNTGVHVFYSCSLLWYSLFCSCTWWLSAELVVLEEGPFLVAWVSHLPDASPNQLDSGLLDLAILVLASTPWNYGTLRQRL